MRLWINDEEILPSAPQGAALLDFLRDDLGLKGTKAGCREGDCGACTVLVGSRREDFVRYEPVCACLVPLLAVADRHVVTVEGLSGAELGPVQQAIIAQGATQCGFCTPGIVLSLTGYWLEATEPSEAGAVASVAGNLCRCTGYASIRRACQLLVAGLPKLEAHGPARLSQLAALGIWPHSFLVIADGLPCALTPLAGPKKKEVDTLLVGGSTDLMVQKAALVRGSQLVLSSALATHRIEVRGDELAIGAAATIRDLERSELLLQEIPLFPRITTLIASPQIRSRATVAGNLVNASPIGDLAILLLALDASLVIEGAKGPLSMPLERFFLGYKQVDLRPDELIVELLVPIRRSRRLLSFEKVCKREHLDIATVNSACAVEVDETGRILSARLSAGGVAPVPKVLKTASLAMVGRCLDSMNLDEVIRAALAEISPIDDVRGTATYKRALLERMIAAHHASLQAQSAPSGEQP